MQLKIRDSVYDAEILAEIQAGEYFPDVINYTALENVIDVGAHIGVFTAYVKQHSPDCNVWAIEMDAENYALLLENTNQWLDVIAIHAYCGYSIPARGYYRNRENYGNITLFASPEDTHERINAIPHKVTLEQLTIGFDYMDLLKLDCEGAESDILLGANRATLAKFKWITGEYHPFYGVDIQAILAQLPDFEPIEIQEANGTWGHFLLRNVNAN